MLIIDMVRSWLAYFHMHGAKFWFAKLKICLVKGDNVLVTAANKLWKDKCVDSKGFPSQLDAEVALGQRNNLESHLVMTSILLIIIDNAVYFLLTSLSLIQIQKLQRSFRMYKSSNGKFSDIFLGIKTVGELFLAKQLYDESLAKTNKKRILVHSMCAESLWRG